MLLAAAPCTAPLPAQRADTAATKAALLAADSALAEVVRAKGAGAFLDAADPGAAVLFPGQPILRADSARTPFVARYGGASVYAWRAAHAVAGADGRFGCTVGFSRFRNAADTLRAEHGGTYLTCWRRGADRRWYIAGHQRNDSPPDGPRGTAEPVLANAPHSATEARGGEVRPATQKSEAAFAAMAALPEGPGPAFAKFIAPDGMLFSGADGPRGPDGVRTAFKDYPADRVIRWGPMREFGGGSGGLAFTVGHSTNGPRAGKTGPTRNGKFMTVWRQNPDRTWSYIFDLGSPRP